MTSVLEKSQSVASDSALLASFLLSLLLSIKENGYSEAEKYPVPTKSMDEGKKKNATEENQRRYV